MGSVSSQLIINDGMTSALKRINRAMSLMLDNFEAVQRASGKSINTANIISARQEIGRVNVQLDIMEREYRNINNQQDALNRKLKAGSTNADEFYGKIKGIAAAYIGVSGLQKMTNLSDTLTGARARLSFELDDNGSIKELENKIFASAQSARSSYTDTMSQIAKLSTTAGKAFSKNNTMGDDAI